MRRILVTGGEGLLGTRLCSFLSKKYDVVSADINMPKEKRNYKVIKLDITDKGQIEKNMLELIPDVVVHAAALTDVDFCELNHKKADQINVDGTKNIVEACKKINAKLLFISTDFVFDGKRGPYTETAVPNPINYYGKTKKEGEDIVKNSGLPYLVVRTTVLYGEHKNKLSFVSWVIQQLKNGNQINIVKDQYTTPTWVDDLANALVFLIDKDYFKREIVHVVSQEVVSRYEFARKIADAFGLKKELIIPITSEKLKNPASRPKKGGMRIDKILSLGYKPLTIEESLKRMKNEWERL